MTETKRYLGDSVYVDVQDYGIVLTTENGLPDDPSNTIFLEPQTIRSLYHMLQETYDLAQWDRWRNV